MQNRENNNKNEKTPLLPNEPAEKTSNKLVRYGANTAKGLLAAGGAGGGIAFYLGPAEYCAKTPGCGLELAQVITPKGAFGLYVISGVDYAVINALFSAMSVEHFIQYVKKQTTLAAKIGKGGGVIIYALAQDGAILVTSLKTSTAAWQTFLAVGGGLPGALYGSTLLAEHQIPHLASATKFYFNKAYHPLRDFFHPISEEEKLFRKKIIHYDLQRKNFFELLDANLNYIIRNSDKLSFDKTQTRVSYLFGFKNSPKETWGEYIVHNIGNFLGLGLSADFATPFVKNAFTGVKDYVPSLPLELLLAGFLLSSQAYTNFKLTMDGTTGILDTLYDLLRGKPINSLAFRTHPKTTVIATLVCIFLAAFSYSAMKMLMDSELPNDGSYWHKANEISAINGIDIYHLAGMMHFFNLLLTHLSRDERLQFFAEVKNVYENLRSMTREEFMDFAEKNTPEENAMYCIESFDQDQNPAHLEAQIQIKVEDITDKQEKNTATTNTTPVKIEEPVVTTSTQPTKKSGAGSPPTLFGRVYNWITNTHPDDDVENDNSYVTLP